MGVVEALRIGVAVARALVEAHHAGVLHRDLKPHNVLISDDGRILVADFGLAKLTDDAADSSRRPQLVKASDVADSQVFGSPRYMAPEQWQQGELGPRTDVWALGVILFELLSGRPPFNEPTWAKQWKEVCSSRSAPRLDACCEVPLAIADLVASCLQKEPAERPNAEQLLDKLIRLTERGLAANVAIESPFRGLLPFLERHAAWFFGRDREIAAFVERLRTQPIMPLVGASGVGKSSFVGAGVVARLREQERWQVVKAAARGPAAPRLGIFAATSARRDCHRAAGRSNRWRWLHALLEYLRRAAGNLGQRKRPTEAADGCRATP